MQTLHIDLNKTCDNSYDILIGHGLLAKAAETIGAFCEGGRAVIISDPTVSELYLKPLQDALKKGGIECDSVICKGGETAKSFSEYQKLAEQLLAKKIDRKTLLIALGGGICGDLCGFLAATLLRSLPFVQIPTSLLAQVDSAVGGKVGINTKQGKNLLGAFYQPKLVLCDMDLLESLPVRQLQAGYAEILKYALINDAEHFAWLEQNGAAIIDPSHPDHKAHIAYAVEVSCRKKAEIVAADEKENDTRALLNLGHTFAHALEACRADDDELLHGEAVAMGLDLAARLSVECGFAKQETAETIQAHLQKLKMPRLPKSMAKISPATLIDKMRSDKKTTQGRLHFVLLRKIGDAFLTDKAEEAQVEKILTEYMGTS